MIRPFLCVLTSIWLAPMGAYASNFTIEKSDSTIGFEAEQAGETFKGHFPDYDADITFNAAAPENTKINITIRMAKVRVEGEDRQEEIIGGEWFDVTRYATSSFAGSGVTKQEDGSYIAEGALTIRGVEKAVTLPFTLTPRGRDYYAKGKFTINRRDFNVGTGQWEKDTWVAYPVMVFFDLLCVQQTSTTG